MTKQFSPPNEAYRQDLVNLTNHGKDISQMVWGTIWVVGRSKLIIMERDNQSPRGGFSANSYINTLENGLIPNYEPGLILQQDNARIHIAEVGKNGLKIMAYGLSIGLRIHLISTQ